MKKFLLFPIVLLVMVGCGPKENSMVDTSKDAQTSTIILPSNNTVEDKPKEIVELTKDNFSTYVAVNCSSSLISNETSRYTVVYYAYFIGADYCKFVNCTVTYTYVYAPSGSAGEEITVPLTLSGDGQADPYFAQLRDNYYYTFKFISASGTVMVYR